MSYSHLTLFLDQFVLIGYPVIYALSTVILCAKLSAVNIANVELAATATDDRGKV